MGKLEYLELPEKPIGIQSVCVPEYSVPLR